MNEKIKEIFLTKDQKQEACEDTKNCHTDVIIVFGNGDTFGAPFFSLKGIKKINEENKKSGEFLFGKYFWAERMVIVGSCEMREIRAVIDHLIDEGDFYKVFEKL